MPTKRIADKKGVAASSLPKIEPVRIRATTLIVCRGTKDPELSRGVEDPLGPCAATDSLKGRSCYPEAALIHY